MKAAFPVNGVLSTKPDQSIGGERFQRYYKHDVGPSPISDHELAFVAHPTESVFLTPSQQSEILPYFC